MAETLCQPRAMWHSHSLRPKKSWPESSVQSGLKTLRLRRDRFFAQFRRGLSPSMIHMASSDGVLFRTPRRAIHRNDMPTSHRIHQDSRPVDATKITQMHCRISPRIGIDKIGRTIIVINNKVEPRNPLQRVALASRSVNSMTFGMDDRFAVR